MQSVDRSVRRRAFLGSALTLGAGAALGGTVSFPVAGASAAHHGIDPVHEELIRQLKAAVRGMRGPKPGEAARKVASTVLVAAAHCRSQQMDATVKRQLQAMIRREGRDAVLRKELDPAMLAAEARAFGVDGLPAPPVVDLAHRAKVLDAVLAGGITPFLTAAAADFERLAEALDRLPIAAVNARQDRCPDLTAQILTLEAISMISCLINPILCAYFGGMLFGLKASLWLYGC